MDWLRSEDLKEEKNVTAPIVIIAGEVILRTPEEGRSSRRTPRRLFSPSSLNRNAFCRRTI